MPHTCSSCEPSTNENTLVDHNDRFLEREHLKHNITFPNIYSNVVNLTNRKLLRNVQSLLNKGLPFIPPQHDIHPLDALKEDLDTCRFKEKYIDKHIQNVPNWAKRIVKSSLKGNEFDLSNSLVTSIGSNLSKVE